ncbi:putative endonuclease involved in recombination [Nostoc sp. PCC 7524]|nr:putative endonuclease involved in recombination [Nostoc sp. PCC 7524]
MTLVQTRLIPSLLLTFNFEFIMTFSNFSPTQPVILGFDPGKDKCGLAVMGLDRQLYYHQVVPSLEAITTIDFLRQQFPVSLMVMGNQTTAKRWKQQLHQELVEPLNIVLVDERYSTLEARDRYWQMYPPKGLTKLLPQGMRQPPRPIDDIVAILLIERYLNRLTEPVNS